MDRSNLPQPPPDTAKLLVGKRGCAFKHLLKGKIWNVPQKCYQGPFPQRPLLIRVASRQEHGPEVGHGPIDARRSLP